MLLDDAEIDEVFKKIVVGDTDKISVDKTAVLRKESFSWLLPANRKFFEIDTCLSKYNEVYWTQNYKIQKGDVVYIYSSSPDSCVKYKLSVEAHDLQSNDEFEREKEFYIDEKDFELAKKRNRFVKLRLLAQSHAQQMSLPHLLENGLSMAPRGGLNLSNNGSQTLLKYIESNF